MAPKEDIMEVTYNMQQEQQTLMRLILNLPPKERKKLAKSTEAILTEINKVRDACRKLIDQ